MTALMDNENYPPCSCGRDKVVYYCKIRCNNQASCCSHCAEEHHPHGPVHLYKVIQEKARHWSKIFEDVETLQAKVEGDKKSSMDLIRFCELATQTTVVTLEWDRL